MRKLMTAISFAALALIGINAGVAQTKVQTADVKYDFPTNAQEDDINLRDIADVRYDFPADEIDGDDPVLSQSADIRYDFPADEIDGDDPVLNQIADLRGDQRSAPTGGDDDPSMRLFSGSKA